MTSSTEKPVLKEFAISKIAVAVLLAIVTATVTYVVSVIQEHRKERASVVSNQIEKLYGPLFALSQANEMAWCRFREEYWPRRAYYFDPNVPLKPSDIDLWRRWMQAVFQPMNTRMEDAIVKNAHLLVGDKMPPVFLQFVAHTEAYKSVIAKWSSSDVRRNDRTYLSTAENVAPMSFPKQQLAKCIREQFYLLNTLQQTLQSEWIGSSAPLRETVPTACEVLSQPADEAGSC